MHSQISQLQVELEEVRTLSKRQGLEPDLLQSGEGGLESITEEAVRQALAAGIRQSPTDGADFVTPDSRQETLAEMGGERLTDFAPEGQSLSPRQLRPHVVDRADVEFLRRTDSPQAYTATCASPPTRDRPADQRSTGSQASQGHSRSSSKRTSPVEVEELLQSLISHETRSQEGVRSPDLSQGSPRDIHKSLREDKQGSQDDGPRTPTRSQRSPVQIPMSPSELHKALREGRRPSNESHRSSSESHKSDGHRSPTDRQQRPSSGKRGSPRGQGSPASQGERGSPSARAEQSGTFTLDSERLVYNPTPQGYSEAERYIGEDGQLYDRDGNIRPRYTISSEGHHADQGQVHTSPREQSQGQTQVGHIPLADQSGEPETHGLSTEAERYIQQLRRELLITKTALMQIQKGERFDQGEGEDDHETHDLDPRVTDEVSPRAHTVDLASRSELAYLAGQGDTGFSSAQTQRSRVDYEEMTVDGDLQQVQRQLEQAREELELFRTSSNLSARDFVQASGGSRLHRQGVQR